MEKGRVPSLDCGRGRFPGGGVKYLGYLLMNEGETEQEIDRQIGAMTSVT